MFTSLTKIDIVVIVSSLLLLTTVVSYVIFANHM